MMMTVLHSGDIISFEPNGRFNLWLFHYLIIWYLLLSINQNKGVKISAVVSCDSSLTTNFQLPNSNLKGYTTTDLVIF